MAEPMRFSNMVRFCTNVNRTCKEINYIFTNDMAFGIKVYGYYWDSNYLYINDYVIQNIDPSSPLAMLINDGFIVQVKTNEELYNEDQKIQGTFHRFRFFRKLIDNRISKTGTKLSDTNLNENDCLNFSEFFTLQQRSRTCTFPYDYKASVLQSKDNGSPFGVSDEENIELLKKIPPETSDYNAVPLPGESYAIVRKKMKAGSMYHIAYCIYRHNNINITLEANADSGREYLPKFNFYDTNTRGFTFHKRYIQIYDNSKTIVLQGRNIRSILSEIDEEIREKNKQTAPISMLEGGVKIKRKRKHDTRKNKKKRT
jgi:hypothetical protein